MTGISDFVQQSHDFIATTVNLSQDSRWLYAPHAHPWQMAVDRLIDGPRRRMEPISLRTPLALLLISLGLIAAVWWWLATPITLAARADRPQRQAAMRLLCAVPRHQTPLVPTTHIPAEQIAQDLRQLAKITDCVRTYSIENGLDQVPALAAKVGLKVIQGIWLGSNRLKNLAQIATAVRPHQGIIPASSPRWSSATRCCCAAR